MKKITLLFFALITTFSVFAQTKLTVSKGDVLVYHVNAFGSEYDFIVTVNEIGSKLDFDWKMTAPANKAANVKISEDALKTATSYNNFFNGSDMNLTNQSTVWMSKKNFDELMKGSTTMNNGKGNASYAKAGTEKMIIKYKGKDITIESTQAKDVANNQSVWVLNNADNHLITKMSLGWTIELKEVR